MSNFVKSICFLMPSASLGPIGGYKIVYEYANRFVADGWSVAIVNPMYIGGIGESNFWKFMLRHPRAALISLWLGYKRVKKARLPDAKWFPLDQRIKMLYPIYISPRLEKKLPKDTRFVATYVLTAEALNQFKSPHRYQLIQDRENWGGITLEQVHLVYRYDMVKIAISEWLRDEVVGVGEKCLYVPNALDFSQFRLQTSITDRASGEIAMLWNDRSHKRVEDALAAIALARERHPNIRVVAFGTCDRPTRLPSWCDYVQRPDNRRHNSIYNTAAIFVAASELEGWGLTVSEAMICGAAVACTDTSGFKSFCRNEETALMSPVRDPEALAKNICRLIEDDELRIRIATAGYKSIQQFTWERSFGILKRVFESEK